MLQRYHAGIHQYFAGMLEIHRHAVADSALHLAQPPIGLAGVADILAGFEVRAFQGKPPQKLPYAAAAGR